MKRISPPSLFPSPRACDTGEVHFHCALCPEAKSPHHHTLKSTGGRRLRGRPRPGLPQVIAAPSRPPARRHLRLSRWWDRPTHIKDRPDGAEPVPLQRVMSNLFAGGDFMRKQFNELDRDGDGFISEADLKASIQGHPVHSCAINCFFRRYDQDGDRKISFEEYRNGLLAYLFQNLRNEEMARSLFHFLDTDKSGAVSMKELYKFFEGCIGTVPQEYVEGFLKGLDANNDGEINESEFLTFVKNNWSKQCKNCCGTAQQFIPSSMR